MLRREIDDCADAAPALAAAHEPESAGDVVTASLRGLELGEIVCAPGVERAGLLPAVFDADLAAFGAQSPELARRYRAPEASAAES